jgi:hypothetical protein
VRNRVSVPLVVATGEPPNHPSIPARASRGAPPSSASVHLRSVPGAGRRRLPSRPIPVRGTHLTAPQRSLQSSRRNSSSAFVKGKLDASMNDITQQEQPTTGGKEHGPPLTPMSHSLSTGVGWWEQHLSLICLFYQISRRRERQPSVPHLAPPTPLPSPVQLKQQEPSSPRGSNNRSESRDLSFPSLSLAAPACPRPDSLSPPVAGSLLGSASLPQRRGGHLT